MVYKSEDEVGQTMDSPETRGRGKRHPRIGASEQGWKGRQKADGGGQTKRKKSNESDRLIWTEGEEQGELK